VKLDIAQLEFIEPKLREIALDVEKTFGVEFTITSLYRINNNGVHGTLPLRGIDLRCRNDHLGHAVEDYVNDKWEYNGTSGKNCCLYHQNRKGGGKHIHLQVHPNTRER
jgi:hypothetical protein